MKAGLNHVIVAPIGSLDYDTKAGIAVAEYIDTFLLSSCIGIVVDVGEMYYGGWDLRVIGPRPHGANIAKAQRINELSLEFDVDCEVKPGDIVLFKYIANTDADSEVNGNRIVKYDQLLARVDGPGASGVYPLNGYVFLEVRDHNYQVGGLRVTNFREPGWGVVVAEGMLVRNYLYWPDQDGDPAIELKGKEVCFKNAMAVRIEHDGFRALEIETEYPLYYLNRLQINGYTDDR